VALKLSADGLLHKSDVGGVHHGLDHAAAVGAPGEEVTRVATSLDVPVRALVQSMAPEGVEVIVGSRVDPAFGPVVMVGTGGIHAEVLRDVQVRLAPVTSSEAMAMVEALGIAPVLRGARGRGPADVEALAEVVSRLSAAAVAWQVAVAEIDLNPVVVLPRGEGVRLVDAALVAATDSPQTKRR
jgi:hypothetical protein